MRVLVCLVLFFFQVNCLSAESRTIYGLDFPYQDLKEIDDNQVKLDVAGNEKIIAKDDLDSELVSAAFSSDTYKPKADKLLDFYVVASKANNQKLAKLAFIKASTLDLSTKQAEVFYESLSDDLTEELVAADVENNFLLINKDSSLGYLFLVSAWKKYPKAQVQQCCDQEKLYDFFLQFNSNVLDAKYLGFFNNFLSGYLPYQRIKNYQKILYAKNVKPRTFIRQFQELQEKYPEYTDETVSFYKSQSRELIKELLESNQIRAALDLIILEEELNRTETTHESLLEIISKISYPTKNLLLTEPYQSLFKRFSEKDSRIKKALIVRTQDLYLAILEQKELFQAEEVYQSLITYRENPNVKNQELVMKLLDGLFAQDLRTESNSIIAANMPYFTIGQKLDLFFKGYLIAFWKLGLAILTLLAIAFHFLRKSTFGEGLYKKIFVREFVKEEEKLTGRRVKNSDALSQFNSLNPNLIRYKRLLEVFGLEDGVTDDEIKSTYRKQIKSFHPDLNPDQGEYEKNKFLEITENYEKLLKLYAELNKKPKKEENDLS